MLDALLSEARWVKQCEKDYPGEDAQGVVVACYRFGGDMEL